MVLLVLAALVVVGVPVALALSRANELFALRVVGGQIHVVRGRVPRALLSDFMDVLRGTATGEIRVVVEGGRPRLDVRGAVAPDVVQRLRNVLGRFTVGQIRSTARSRGVRGPA